MHIFDRFSIGIVLLDHRGRVLFANAAANTLADNRQLTQRMSLLESSAPSASRRLKQLLEQGEGALGISRAVPHHGGASATVLLMATLHRKEAAQLGRGLQNARSVLFVFDPASPQDFHFRGSLTATG